MSTFELLALTSSLIMVTLELVLRALQRERDQSWFLSILGSWAGGLALLPFIPYETLNLSPTTILLLVVAGASWAVSVFADCRSLATLPVGLAAILSSLRTVVLIGSGAIFFGETFTARDALGTALAIAGVLIALSSKPGRNLAGVGPRIVALMASGAAIVTEKALAQRTAIELVIAGGYLIPGVLYLILKPRGWREQCALGSPQRKALIVLYMLLYIAIGPVFVTAFAFGSLGETFIIFQSRFVLTILLGALILHEREGLFRKCVGMITTLLGVYLVVI